MCSVIHGSVELGCFTVDGNTFNGIPETSSKKCVISGFGQFCDPRTNMKLASFSAIFFLLTCSVHAGELPVPIGKLLVSIKAVQVTSKVPETIRFDVVNSSTSTVVVDERKLQEPGYDISKGISERNNEEKDLCVSKEMSFSTDQQRPPVDQRPKPPWMISIPSGQTFTMELPAHKLLHDVDTRFLHGEIKVVFSVSELLLAVGGKETDEQTFHSAVKANEVTVRWH